MKKILGVILLIILIVLGFWFFVFYTNKASQSVTGMATSTAAMPIATAAYMCDAGKSINASYYQGTTTPVSVPGQPPTPTGTVALTLSDGRNMTLPQTISADGARYASKDGSIVFWNKGNGVTFTENNTLTYTGCIQIAQDPGGLPQTYIGAGGAFSIRYPVNYTVDDKYTYQELGPGKNISGTKFTIDPAIAKGTNLSPDSYISVEQIPKQAACTANLFLDLGTAGTLQTITDGNTNYSVASSTGAGAGNRYAETVYAIPGTNPCVAIRYFIHYGVIENYPAGTVNAFNQSALIAQFDAIRHTLILNQ